MKLPPFPCSLESSPSSSLPFTPEPGPSSTTAISASTSNFDSFSAASSFNWIVNSTPSNFHSHEDVPDESGAISNAEQVSRMKSKTLVTSLEAGLFSEFTILREEEEVQGDGVTEEDEESSFEQCSADFEEKLLSQSVQLPNTLSSAYMNGHQDDAEFIEGSSSKTQHHFARSSTTPPPVLLRPLSKPIIIHFFYPLDPLTLIQQQSPVYNNPLCPIVKPIPEWPPPELVEWRKYRGRIPCRDTIEGERKRKADESSEDERHESNYSTATHGRAVKRVRWKSVDDIAPPPVFKNMAPITIDPQRRPYISLPSKGSVDKSLYRAISVPRLSPPSLSDDDDEDMVPQLGRGRRRRKPGPRFSDLSFEKRGPKPSIKTPRSLGPAGRACHQCRNTNTPIPPPKIKCSALKPNGQVCSFVYCLSCITNRYDEPFEASAKTWTCPCCREMCNCSLCIRGAGFGYIWDGPLAMDIKQGKLRGRGLKAVDKQGDPDLVPSIRTWFARQGVVTGSPAWMSQRRKEGVRFIVGRNPDPGLDSSTYAFDCEFIRQFEMDTDGDDEGDVDRNGTFDENASEQRTIPVNSAGSPSSSSSSSTSPLPSLNDVFSQCLSGSRKRFYIGQIPKRVKVTSRPTTMPRPKPRIKTPSAGAREDVENVEQPHPMKVLRPPSKEPGFYVEDQESSEAESEDEAEDENKAEAGMMDETAAAVVQNESLSQLESQPVSSSSSEPALSYTASVTDPTPNSTPDTLYTSPGALGPLNLHEFRDLHSPAPIQTWSASALNAQGMALEKRLANNAREAEIRTEVANWSDVTASPVVDPSHPQAISPARTQLVPNMEDDFTLPLPEIYTFAQDPLVTSAESLFAASGGNNTECEDDEDEDAMGETETEKSSSVGVDER